MTTYVLSADREKVMALVRPPLSVVHQPLDEEGNLSPWPWGLTDGTNYGWFEKNQLLFWGMNSCLTIITGLREVGVRVEECY